MSTAVNTNRVWAWCPKCGYRTEQARVSGGLACQVCGTVSDALGNVVKPLVIKIKFAPVALWQSREGGNGE